MNLSIVKYARAKKLFPPFDAEMMRLVRGSTIVHSAGFELNDLPALQDISQYSDIESKDTETSQ